MSYANQDLEYLDVISGKKSHKLTELPEVEKGYDSYMIMAKKPSVFPAKGSRGIARYIDALPIKKLPLSLGEGSTPLIESKLFENVYIKNEGVNPTGNFKDRESAIVLAYAHEKGYKDLAIASSGNAALSAALYSRIYNIRTTCYVPTKTPEAKKDMIKLFGAQMHVVGDTYEDSYHYLAENLPKGSINITSGSFPLRSDGFKTIAYEIWEDLGEIPDVVLCPAGNGSALSSIFHGFVDLKEWGLTDKLPTMVSVQIEGGDPINRALLMDEWIVKIKENVDSSCEAIVANESFCSPRAIYALKKSKGFGISVSDHQVIDGLRYAIDKEGIFPEFSSASVFAALLENEGRLREKGNKIVLINTATGLKETESLHNKLYGRDA